MKHSIEAVYEGGVFRPLVAIQLDDHQRVRLTVQCTSEAAETELAAWQQVYAGLSSDDVDEVDAVIKDRSSFMRPGQ